MAENTYLNNKLDVNGENLLLPRNMSYIADLKSDTQRYINFLSTMSKFYRHETSNLPSFALEAPQYFTAVATENMWSLMGYYINDNAKGVTLYENGEIVQGYDASEVTAKNDKAISSSLWQYNEAEHKKYLDAVVPGEADTVQKIMALSEHIVESYPVKEETRELIANSIAHVTLERLGQSTHNADVKIFLMDLSNQEIDMEELTDTVHRESRKILDAFRDIAQNNFEKSANPLLSQVDTFTVEAFETENDVINQNFERVMQDEVKRWETNNIPDKDRTLIDSDYEEEETLSTSESNDNNNENKEEMQVTNSSVSANDFILYEYNGGLNSRSFYDVTLPDNLTNISLSHIEEMAKNFNGWRMTGNDIPTYRFDSSREREAFMVELCKDLNIPNDKFFNPRYEYFLNARPLSPGAQPKDFVDYDEGLMNGRYGAIYYNRELTEEEIKEYELTPSPFNQTNAYIIGNKEKERLANEEATSQNIDETSQNTNEVESAQNANIPNKDRTNEEATSQNTDETSQDTVESSQNATLFRFKVRDEAVAHTNFQSQSQDDYIAEMDMSEETFKKFEHVTTSLVNEWGIQEVKAGKYENGKGIFTFSTAQERDRFVSQAEDGLNNSKGAGYYSININGNKVNISNDDGKVSGAKSTIYKAKEVLKAYGGKWNKEEKAWYLENEEERNKLISRFLGRFHFGEDRTLVDSDYEEETLPTSEIKDNNNEETQVINSSVSVDDFSRTNEAPASSTNTSSINPTQSLFTDEEIKATEAKVEKTSQNTVEMKELQDGDNEQNESEYYIYFSKEGKYGRELVINNHPTRNKENMYKVATEKGATIISKEEYYKGIATDRMNELFIEDNIEKIFDVLSVNDNTYSIKAFSELSGISLDKTWKRREQQLIDYYGEKYTKWQEELETAAREKEKAEKEAQEENFKKEASEIGEQYYDYAKNLSPMQRARVGKILGTRFRYDDKIQTRAQNIEELFSDGKLAFTYNDSGKTKYAIESRETAFSVFYDVTKTEFDYWNYLYENSNVKIKPQHFSTYSYPTDEQHIEYHFAYIPKEQASSRYQSAADLEEIAKKYGGYLMSGSVEGVESVGFNFSTAENMNNFAQEANAYLDQQYGATDSYGEAMSLLPEEETANEEEIENQNEAENAEENSVQKQDFEFYTYETSTNPRSGEGYFDVHFSDKVINGDLGFEDEFVNESQNTTFDRVATRHNGRSIGDGSYRFPSHADRWAFLGDLDSILTDRYYYRLNHRANINEQVNGENFNIIDIPVIESVFAIQFGVHYVAVLSKEASNFDLEIENINDRLGSRQMGVKRINENANAVYYMFNRKADRDAFVSEANSYINDIRKTNETNNTKQSSKLLSVEDALSRINGNSYEKNMFRDNVRAILTLKNLNGREATEAEKEILKKYHGFGGLADAFSDKENWQSEESLLHEILSPSEYIEARSTVLNAHYTSPAIVRGIYNGISQLGFNGGRILEPSMGIGAFLEDMPQEMRKNSNIHGIELDSITGHIAKAIHTDANIQIKGFEKALYENKRDEVDGNIFDLTISNVPFGNYSVNDVRAYYNENNMLIHDYFAYKMLNETRPNGICALITTHNTLDKLSKSARVDLYNKAELVRAIRLPNTAFKGAGTSVTTDILILRKREKPLSLTVDSNNLPSWVETQPFNGDEDVWVNSYFIEHPEYVLGELKKTTNAYGYEVVCEGSSDNLEEQISNAFKGIEPFYVPEVDPQEPVDSYKENVENSSVQIINDEIIFFDGYGKSQKMEAATTELDRIKMILPVRDALNELIKKQLQGVTDEEFEKLKDRLNTTYDDYVKNYGRIRNSRVLKKFLAEDNSYYRLLALEVYEKNSETNRPEFKEKAPIFSKRVINTYTSPTSAKNSTDALAISMQEKGQINLPYMAYLTGKSNDEVLSDLYGKEIFFDYDDSVYVTTDEYLSGDVRSKLENLEKRLEDLNKKNEVQALNEVLNTLRPLPNSKLPDAETDLDKLLDDYHDNPEKYKQPRRNITKALTTVLEENKYSVDDVKAATKEHKSTYDRILAYASYGNYKDRDLNVEHVYETSPSTIIPYLFKGQNFRDFTLFRTVIGYYSSDYPYKDYLDSFKVVTGADQNKSTQEDFNKARIVTDFMYKIAEEYDGNPQKLYEDLRGGNSYQTIEIFRARFDEYMKDIEAKVQKRSVEIAEENAQSNALERENLLIGINALKKVIPQDLTAEDIHTEIGASWIPEEDYQDFIYEILGEDLKVSFSGKIGNGNWQIEKAKYVNSNQATNIYGTPNMNGVMIMQSLLNLTMPKINKKITVNGEEQTVVDQEATLQVQQKAEEIKTAFNNWIWSDEERKERLVKYYNRHFNNIVPRSFNGDNLVFPAMSPNIRLRKHQKDAIARTLYGKNNALFAHSVGAGKTFEIVASIMESKRLGLAKKSLVVVPKHLTEQFGTEFLQLYPTANILVANAKEFTKDSTKEFCTKIATGDWDAVVMSYNQFERIPLSKERQKMFFEDEVNNIVKSIHQIKKEEGSRFTIKAAETYKKKIEARLAKLQKKDDKEYVVNFEELGIDHLYVDEAHNYKNLYTFTKLANVSGVSNSDAKKTQDMLFKCQYLNEIKNGRCNIVFATGTPISNTMTELYTMQRYLVPERLEEEGLDYFDAWASTFGKVETVMELKPEGKGFQPRTRFSKFYNIPELLTMFKDFADIKMADDLKLDVPEATIKIENMKANEYQEDYVNQLAERAKQIRNGGVDPTQDNMLLITSEGRKLALDQRLINPDWPDDPNSKLNKCVQNVLDIHKEHPTEAQLIFCDISTPNNNASKKDETKEIIAANGLVYNDIKQKLIAGGMNEKEIAFIHDAKTEEAKDALFAKVRAGEVKVLIGSTSMMGTGTNVQDHLIASHDLDIPWRPSDLEQRMGRIVRQGNLNKKVKVFRYVTEGTFDAYLWQILENKQRFISQIMNSKSVERAAEDVDEATLSYAEIKAIATGNPLIKEKIDIDMQISKLKYAKSSYNLGQSRMKKIIEHLPGTIEKNKADLPLYENCANIINANMEAAKNANNDFSMEINGKTFNKMKDAIEALKAHKEKAGSFLGFKGKCYGMPFEINYSSTNSLVAKMTSPDGKIAFQDFVNFQAPYTIGSIKYLAERYVKSAKNLKELIISDEAKLKSAQEEYGKPFAHEEELENLISRSLAISTELDSETEQTNTQEENEDDIKISRENYIKQADIESLGKTLDVAYLVRAKKVMENGSYSEKMENEIIQQLLQFKIPMKEIGSVVLKYSPLQPEEEHLKRRILKIVDFMHNNSKIAAAR